MENALITALGWDSDGELSPEARATKATIERLQYQIPTHGLTTAEIKERILTKNREMTEINEWLGSGVLRADDEINSLRGAIAEIEKEIILLLSTVPTDRLYLNRV